MVDKLNVTITRRTTRTAKIELAIEDLEQIVRVYFEDHVGESLGPNAFKWDLSGQLPVLRVEETWVEGEPK